MLIKIFNLLLLIYKVTSQVPPLLCLFPLQEFLPQLGYHSWKHTHADCHCISPHLIFNCPKVPYNENVPILYIASSKHTTFEWTHTKIKILKKIHIMYMFTDTHSPTHFHILIWKLVYNNVQLRFCVEEILGVNLATE